nr:hypothetical protein CFP56_24451 [Quercus suber]
MDVRLCARRSSREKLVRDACLCARSSMLREMIDMTLECTTKHFLHGPQQGGFYSVRRQSPMQSAPATGHAALHSCPARPSIGSSLRHAVQTVAKGDGRGTCLRDALW